MKILRCYNSFVLNVVSIKQLDERIPKQIWIVPIVKPPFQFIQVAVQMLDRQLEIGSVDRAFRANVHQTYISQLEGGEVTNSEYDSQAGRVLKASASRLVATVERG